MVLSLSHLITIKVGIDPTILRNPLRLDLAHLVLLETSEMQYSGTAGISARILHFTGFNKEGWIKSAELIT